MVMDPQYKIPSSQLEDVPIINGDCCVNITAQKSSGQPVTTKDKSYSLPTYWTFLEHYKVILLAITLFVTLIMCISMTMIYMNLNLDLTSQNGETIDHKTTKPANVEEVYLKTLGETEEESSTPDSNEILLELLHNMRNDQYSAFSESEKNRLKRETTHDKNFCNHKIEHCKHILESMKHIVKIVNTNMPHIEALLKSLLANEANESISKSQFIELLECLGCKSSKVNDSINFIDPPSSDNEITNATYFAKGGRLENENDHKIFTTIKLLHDHEQTEEKENSSVRYIENTVDTGNLEVLNSSTEKQEINSSLSSIVTTEYEAASVKATAINGTAGASTTFKAGGPSTNTYEPEVLNGNKEPPSITIDAPMKPRGDNVMKLTNDTVKFSSNEGHKTEGHDPMSADKKLEKEATNDSEAVRMANSYSMFGKRIMTNEHFQTKGVVDPGQMMIPTAETIKSSQQLQLTPTMSWSPYPVCFNGPPTNSAPKHSGPGAVIYPATSPAGSYPISMPQQQRGPSFHNLVNQPPAVPVPNYVQVQAQSVQFYPGNSGPPSASRVGPTGPAMQNFPIFPGHQTPSSSSPATSAKSGYYCTYIPAPTYQFPAIPGVSEYQRMVDHKEQLRKSIDNGALIKQTSIPGYTNSCPLDAIRCADGGHCISRLQWCDSHVDCKDASDETICSCRDRISQERLCDGYFDCPHGEDELGCMGCSKTSFSCNDWNSMYSSDNNCVPLSQRCDGLMQCANGKDEMDCNILTSNYIEGKTVFTIGYANGYLHKNWRGQWYPVCTANNSWAMEACKSEIGPEMNEVPKVQTHSIPENTYESSYLTEENGEIKIVPSCSNTAVYVQCPQIPCGTRVISHQESIPTDMYENEVELFRRGKDEIDRRNNKINKESNNPRNAKSKEQLKEPHNDILGAQLRVVGGRASQPKAWPFLVAIYKDGYFHCGGVILNELWILTAAHCLDGSMDHYFEVQAGMLRRLSFSPMAQNRKARYTIMHPQYDANNMKNDVGMIMLDESLHFNRWVRPVCLPEEHIMGSSWRQSPEPNTTCIAIGWGATRERGPDPDHLREVEVPILPFCKYKSDQNDAEFCAGYSEGGRDACQGDSGGPLMCRSRFSNSQWYVAGIVSHGEGCGRPKEPGAYTKVSYFVQWIRLVSNGPSMLPYRKVPLERCPGFSCEGGLGKCLPIGYHCDGTVDCLDGEDEVFCPSRSNYELLRDSKSSNLELIKNSTKNHGVSTNVSEGLQNFDSRPSMSIEEKLSNETVSVDIEKNTVQINSSVDKTTINPSTEPDTTFTVKTFTCEKLLQTISIDKRCDKVFDCEDGTDELNCTCKDFLSNLQPAAICNGYVDCYDRRDEENCKFCKKDEFFCRKSRECIPLSRRCNGKFDCSSKEDEFDCFTLTDNDHVDLDADELPFLNTKGVLTKYDKGMWQSTCHRPRIINNQSTAIIIGKNMCEYFGFANLQSSIESIVSKSELEIRSWSKENGTRYEYPSTYVPPKQENETCPGLYIQCRPVLSSNRDIHLVVDARTGSRTYLWPWLTAIFVDGSYRCSAILLDRHWLLSSIKCIENVSLKRNYTTAVFGFSPSYRYVEGPFEQISIIDDIQAIKNSVAVLLHLKTPVNTTRHVLPMFLEKRIYPPSQDDFCIAVGTNKDFETISVHLQPVLEDCHNCNRCFANSDGTNCSENETNWSGTIFCRGQKGWYPAAVFYEENSTCGFQNVQNLTSIDYINPYLMQAIEADSRSFIEPPCDGFRCGLGKCIPQSQVCDGIANCRDAADEDPNLCAEIHQNCDNSVQGCECVWSELRCGDGKCLDKSVFCDGKTDCSDGLDETMFCSCADYFKLTTPERLCDGVRHCFDKSDESPEICSCKESSFKCKTTSGNDSCIPQDFLCDGENDCANGEDEAKCQMIKPEMNQRPGLGEVIRRSYGVWHTECLPAPVTTEEEASKLCKSLGYTSGNVISDIKMIDEVLIPSRSEFYMVKLNQWIWLTMREDKPLITLKKTDKICHRAFLDCA